MSDSGAGPTRDRVGNRDGGNGGSGGDVTLGDTTVPATPPISGALVLVVEDEAPIRRFLRAALTSNGYRVEEATTVREATVQAGMHPPDLVLLDLGLPDGDGLDLLHSLRGWSSAPVIVISARGQEQDKIEALDRGADDYLVKPFAVGELLARLRVALRHAAGASASAGDATWTATVGGGTLRVDVAKRRVSLADTSGEREVRLTATEFKMLAMLVRHRGRVLTHRQILQEVWGPTHAGDVHYVRVYAATLRRKIEPDPTQPRFLLTEPSVGYRLVEGAMVG